MSRVGSSRRGVVVLSPGFDGRPVEVTVGGLGIPPRVLRALRPPCSSAKEVTPLLEIAPAADVGSQSNDLQKLEELPEDELRYAVWQEGARRSLGVFARLMEPPSYEQPPHVLMLIDHLERLYRREYRKLIVEAPPRSSKSSHVARIGPAWYLGQHPDHKVMITSYGDELAIGHGRAVRDYLRDDRYPFPGVQINPDSRSAGRWNTNQRGELRAIGIRSGATGYGANLLIVDDPVKDRQEADSAIVRDTIWSQFQESFLTRLQKDGIVCCMATRWHEDDLIGRLLNSPGADEWVRLRLPYFAEADDPLGRAEGDPLDVFGEVPSVEAGEITPRGWSALYQQRPTPAEGGFLKRAWMNRRWTMTGYGKNPEHVYTRLPNNSSRWKVIQSIDASLKDGVGKDFSVIATWGTDGISYYLLDRWKRRVEYPQLRDAAEELYWRWRPREVLVEDAANGRPLIQDLRARTPIPVVGILAKGSKEARIEAVSPLFASGHVVLPDDSSFLEDWIEEHIAFPNAMYDDQVDTTSLALARLSNFTVNKWSGQLFGRIEF